MSAVLPASSRALPADEAPPAWIAAAALAVVLPTVLAVDLPPSVTFANQAAALAGWGLLCLLLAGSSGAAARARVAGGEAALLAAFGLLSASALAAPLWAGLPWTLALSALGMLAAAALVARAGAAVARAGHALPAFHAFGVALLAAGTIGVALGLVQVFWPSLADGTLIAAITAGRAAGNLRQPNHLSSLLLWALIALVWLHDSRRIGRAPAAGLYVLLLAGVVLTGSRTGMLGVLMLLAWGVLDRALAPAVRRALLLAPLVFALLWVALAAWAHATQHGFAGEAQLSKGDLSSSRFGIWSNTLALIARDPWLGVGWGEFNFAWSLTPFPGRSSAFFDHTHNLPLHFAVELGLPLAIVVLVLLGAALWRAFGAAARCADRATASALRAAFMLVLMMAVHSQFEYPLWYAYFLLPTAFAFGLCLAGPQAPPAGASAAGPARGLRLGAVALIAGGALATADYLRVVDIYAPGAGAPPLADRIAQGRHSWFFGHHADYAEVTTEGQTPADPAQAFARAPHYLLDTRLMTAWARALHAAGQEDAARHVAARLREFNNPQSQPFFEVCEMLEGEDAAGLPFQCRAASAPPDFEALRR